MPALPVLNRRLWIVIGGMGAVVLLLVLFLWWVLSGSGHPQEGTTSADRPPILVARSGHAGAIDTMRKALALARPGDRIVVLEEVDEALQLDGKLGRDVTVEATRDKPIVWHSSHGESCLFNSA